MQHILEATSLSPERLARVFTRAASMGNNGYRKMLRGKRVALLFYQASTRTRLSFEAAIKALGGDTLTMSEMKQFSSNAKGESDEDTIRVISSYCHCIVLRHSRAGAAERLAPYSRVPLINAGDGNNEHPTQAYLDLFTIWQAMQAGRLPTNGLNLLFFGDNENSRTVRSLAKLLVSHGPTLGVRVKSMAFCGPNGFAVPPEDVSAAIGHSCELSLPAKPLYAGTDVVYITRPQREYHNGKKLVMMPFTEKMANALPEHAIIMHPLPRTDELPVEVDANPRAWYFTQSENGMLVRMALLWHLLQQ
jgi:aspartate carbamoyltransferase catalytic subunit